jgi:hypothetical protein
MCRFNQYNQQFSEGCPKIFGWEVIPVFECNKFWFYRRFPQTKFPHSHTYESVPSYLNPLGFWPFSFSYFVSLFLFKIYMSTIFKIKKFLTHWTVCRSEADKFNNKAKDDTKKFLELFYLDESIFVSYVYQALREAYYARWITFRKN